MEECPGLDGLQSRVHILDCRGVDGRMPRMGWIAGKTAGDARGWDRLGKVSNATGIHVWVLAESGIGKQTAESDVWIEGTVSRWDAMESMERVDDG
jgi:hypothetical protein